MKAKFYLIAAAACAALAACSKNEVAPVDVDQEITFQAVVNKASTKALIDDAPYPKGATFGSIAYRESAGNQKYFGPEEVKYNTTQNYWSTATAYYWPVKDSLTFMSYSPYKYQEAAYTSIPVAVVESYNTLEFQNYNVEDHQDTDLMVADIKTGQKANTTQYGGTWQKGVPTIFRHKLSQIVAINFQTVDTQAPNTKKDYANGHDGSAGKEYAAGDQQFFLNEVSLRKTCFLGSYKYVASTNPVTVTEGWTKGSTAVDKTLWFTEPSPNVDGKFIKGAINPQRTKDTGENADNNYILILPQVFDNYSPGDESTVPHLYIKYTVRTYYAANGYSDEVIETSVPLYDIHNTNHDWKMNKKISYTFSLTKQRIYWDPKVENWEGEIFSVQI